MILLYFFFLGTTIESAQNELVNVAKELFQGAADIASQ